MKGWEGASTEEQGLVSKLFFILQGRETVSLGCDGSLWMSSFFSLYSDLSPGVRTE